MPVKSNRFLLNVDQVNLIRESFDLLNLPFSLSVAPAYEGLFEIDGSKKALTKVAKALGHLLFESLADIAKKREAGEGLTRTAELKKLSSVLSLYERLDKMTYQDESFFDVDEYNKVNKLSPNYHKIPSFRA